MSKDVALGIDLGGTGIKMGLVDRDGALRHSVRFSTPSKSNARAVADLIGSHARSLLETTGANVIGIGVGTAGDVDPDTGSIRISPNLGWRNVPLKALLARRLRGPIVVENDANAASWGAYVVEAKRRVKNLICITVGTGIGGGLILDGKLYRGATGSAGEIGHATLYPDGIACACGNHGCLERYIGVRALRDEATQAILNGRSSLIGDMVNGNLDKIEPLFIAEAARKGDALALELWQKAGDRLGIALASAVNVLNPEWIVLSGGLSRAGKLLLDPIRRTLLRRSFPTPARAVKLVISKLDQDLGTVGAGLLAFEPR